MSRLGRVQVQRGKRGRRSRNVVRELLYGGVGDAAACGSVELNFRRV